MKVNFSRLKKALTTTHRFLLEYLLIKDTSVFSQCRLSEPTNCVFSYQYNAMCACAGTVVTGTKNLSMHCIMQKTFDSERKKEREIRNLI